jgi:hypothetical protein
MTENPLVSTEEHSGWMQQCLSQHCVVLFELLVD